MADEHIPAPFYRVTITRVEHVRDIRREWQPQAGEPDPMKNGERQYGYAEKPTVEKVERLVLQQEVKDLDVTAVVCAINGITTA